MAKPKRKENRKRKKAAVAKSTRKFRKTAEDGSRIKADYTGPRIEAGFGEWLVASKKYWRKLQGRM